MRGGRLEDGRQRSRSCFPAPNLQSLQALLAEPYRRTVFHHPMLAFANPLAGPAEFQRFYASANILPNFHQFQGFHRRVAHDSLLVTVTRLKRRRIPDNGTEGTFTGPDWSTSVLGPSFGGKPGDLRWQEMEAGMEKGNVLPTPACRRKAFPPLLRLPISLTDGRPGGNFFQLNQVVHRREGLLFIA